MTSPGGRYLALLIPLVPPGSITRRIILTMTNGTYQLGVAVAGPWLGPAFTGSCLAANGVVQNPSCMGTQLGGIDSLLALNPQYEALSGSGVWAKAGWQCEGAATLPAATPPP